MQSLIEGSDIDINFRCNGIHTLVIFFFNLFIYETPLLVGKVLYL